MDLVASCKDKLQYFRIKELKDVLSQLGLSKQGKKQDLVDRILAIIADAQVSKMWTKRPALAREDIAKMVDDTYRKMQVSGAAADLASKAQVIPDPVTLKPKEEVEDTFPVDMKVRCPCGSSLLTESMIRCEDPRCRIWQHIGCVIIPEKPTEGIPPVPSQFFCELCRLSRADPFWSTLSHPLYPVKLMTTNMPTDGTNPVQGVEKTFQLSKSDRELLSKGDYAVQAWCMLLNDKVPFRMQWPQYVDLQVNGFPVRAITRPGSQLLGANGRDDGPNISQYTRDGINKISVTGCDARIFCVGVRLVKRRSLQQILNMIPRESDGESFEDALVRVHRCVGGGGAAENADSDSDLEVVADSFSINLRCPMSGSRIKTAGRFKPCSHMGCFDLDCFVEMQQRSRKWQCPICLKNYSLENLIIDPYFNRIASMMKCCGDDTTEIEVKPDGSWRVKQDCERRDLSQWHLSDGTHCMPEEGEVKHKPDALKPVKQEATSLKIGIRKNRNGVWEVSKQEESNTLSSYDIDQKFVTGGNKVIPMSSSATGSGRGAEESVNQGGVGTANGMEIDCSSSDPVPAYGFTTLNTSASQGNGEVIVLSDSDEENDINATGAVQNSGVIDNGVNFAVCPLGISGSYQDGPGLGTGGSSGLGLFNSGDEEFGLWPLPSTTQGGSTFQLFGSDGAGSDNLANSHFSFVNCPVMNDNMMVPDASFNSDAFVTHPSVGGSSNDLNDGLVDNPLAFGGADPALQLFLPTKPSDLSGQTGTRNQQDMANGLHGEDWISLRIGGDDVGASTGDSRVVNDFDSGHQLHSGEGALDPMAGTDSFLWSSNGSKSERTRERSDSPFLLHCQKRSVRQRMYLSIDSDSDSD